MARQRSNARDDLDRVKDANHKLRAENRNLRKENARLRKELSKIDVFQFEQEVAEAEEQAKQFAPIPSEEKQLNCPKCKSEEFVRVPAGIFLISICKAPGCGFRKRSKSGVSDGQEGNRGR